MNKAEPPTMRVIALAEFEEDNLDTPAVLALLNQLLEGERAGAHGLIEMARGPEPLDVRLVVRDVATRPASARCSRAT